MADYIPHEVGRIRRDKALEYYLSMYKHEGGKIFGYYDGWGLACYSAIAMIKNEKLHHGNFDELHQLGYYKQGVN